MTNDETEAILSELTLQDIPDQYAYIVDAIGIQAFVKLMVCIGGQQSFYVPKIDKLLMPVRNRHIVNDYNGTNEKALAKKYGMSTASIRNIAKGTYNIGGGNHEQR